mgnify:CR=1 FL=1
MLGGLGTGAGTWALLTALDPTGSLNLAFSGLVTAGAAAVIAVAGAGQCPQGHAVEAVGERDHLRPAGDLAGDLQRRLHRVGPRRAGEHHPVAEVAQPFDVSTNRALGDLEPFGEIGGPPHLERMEHGHGLAERYRGDDWGRAGRRPLEREPRRGQRKQQPELEPGLQRIHSGCSGNR